MKKKKTRHKSKKNIEIVTLISNFKEFIKSKYSVSKKIISKFYKSFTENHKDNISAVKEFLLMIIGYGIIINIPAYTFFNFDFNLFTIFSFGIIYYFIKDDFIEWVRRLIAKR